MRTPFTQLYLHCVWATWDRMPLLVPKVERPVYAAILAKCQDLKCEVLAIGGIEDHVHLLIRLHPGVSVANLMKGIKGSSSHLMTHKVFPGEFFKWQGAYRAFTISKDSIPRVRAYIENQKAHHAQDDLWEAWELAAMEQQGTAKEE